MTFVDHLKGSSPETMLLEVAFGKHIITGDLAKSIVTGSSPTHVVKIQHLLGEAFGKGWEGPIGVWFRGVNRDSTKYKFYPGITSPSNSDTTQGIDSVFDQDTPHSNTAWIRLECPNGSETGIPDFDTKNNPPTGLWVLCNCQLGDVYDDVGDVVDSDVLLINPADVIAFGCMEIRRYNGSRVNWESLDTLRNLSDVNVTPDYTTLPQGTGLTGYYYDGASFGTLKSTRIDPVIQYELSPGAPALNIDPADFSVRWLGKIRPRYTETYTFYLTHDNGGKLWVQNLTTALISETTVGTHSATKSLHADSFYDIKLEWDNISASSEFKLEWESASQPRQVVPQDRLYRYDEPEPRFRSHVAFTQRTTFDEFLRSVLFTCNGIMQDDGDKLTFICLEDSTPSFDFNESNIVKNTVRFYPRFSQQELLSLPNRFIADGRDLDSRYLEPFDPPVFVDDDELQEIAGRIIEERVSVGNCSRWQALSNLAHFRRLRKPCLYLEFEGMPSTMPVLQGDVVTVTLDELTGWDEKEFLVIEATDKSIDSGSDDRIFKLMEW